MKDQAIEQSQKGRQSLRSLAKLVGGFACFLVVFWILFGKVIRAAMPAAKGAAGLSGAKQQVLALIMYGSDNNDRLPHRDRWMSVSLPYMRAEALFRDPVDDRMPPDHNCCALASGASLINYMDPENPARTPVTFRSFNAGINASDPIKSPKSDQMGRAWVSWMDGGVSFVKISELKSTFDQAYGAIKKP